jgi:MSHA biogenesis protein MshP
VTRARGFTLVSAIFLMVVLVLLAASLVTLSSVQHATALQQLQMARAQYAARAGVEWAVRAANDPVAFPGGCPAGPTALAPPGLPGFSVEVSCSATTHTLATAAGPADQAYYRVDVVARSGVYGGPDYVRRRVQAKVLGPAP